MTQTEYTHSVTLRVPESMMADTNHLALHEQFAAWGLERIPQEQDI